MNLYDVLPRQSDDIIAFLHPTTLLMRVGDVRRLSSYESNPVRKLLMKSPEDLLTNNLVDSILQAQVGHDVVLVFPCAFLRIGHQIVLEPITMRWKTMPSYKMVPNNMKTMS